MVRRVIPSLLLSSLLAVATTVSVARAGTRAAAPLRAITLGMGYVANVQFAPYYVAAQRGYYRRAGLQVTFNYGNSATLLQLTGAGRVQFANADGTDSIAATAQGIPVEYVAAEYQRFPVAIFALASRRIHRIADLRGKTIGVPGRYGATYVGLLAALYVSGLRPGDVKIVSIGYNQAPSVAQGIVDAAVGYSTNEPLLLARHGYKVTTIEVSSAANLVGAGLVTGRGLIAHDPALVRAFVQATLHGLADTIADPRMAFAACRTVNGLTTLRGRDADDQYAVLLRAIDFWRSPLTRLHGLGYADPAQWRSSAQILRAIGQVAHPAAPDTVFTNTFARGALKM